LGAIIKTWKGKALMSKKRSGRKGRAPSKAKRRTSATSSLIIPAVVGLVVVAIIVGAILSFENQQSAVAAVPGDGLAPLDTAGASPTNEIPFPNVPRISLQEAQAKLETGELVMVDVRSGESYARSHVAGSVSMPEEQVVNRLGELPRDKEIALYCT
jgi:hypothetical protein